MPRSQFGSLLSTTNLGTSKALSALVAAGLPLGLGGCAGSILDAHGPIGAANAKILLDAVAVMLVVVVPTLVAAAAFAWWFRATNRQAEYWPDWVYNGELELVIWGIPILVILFLGGLIWYGSHELDPFKPIASQKKALEVQVVSLDWKWLFIYPDEGVASVNAVVVPTGVPVHFSLTSASVMNMFFVPQLGSMIATMPAGMVTQLYLQADTPRSFEGLSTQYSGDGFAGMRFVMRAMPENEYAAWLDAARTSGPSLDRAAYEALERQSQNVAPYTYRAVAPNLFGDITSLAIPPAPGPDTTGNAATVRPVSEH